MSRIGVTLALWLACAFVAWIILGRGLAVYFTFRRAR
jgi:hypothetical protein